ncbi:MAG: TRAM domain-containing protein, partial [Chlamydiia bacterium]|nr:TRAM domain-containing protein [Chlamydiia bacterium]
GTPAFRWMDDIPEEIKQERLQRLLSLHSEIASAERQNMLGQQVEVLVEKAGEEGKLKARTRCWKNVVFEGSDAMIGTLQRVKLHSFTHQTLLGELSSPQVLPLML